MSTLTIEQVKEVLPDVMVSLGPKLEAKGRVSGRKKPFATVSIIDNFGISRHYQFSWEAVTRAINDRHALRIF